MEDQGMFRPLKNLSAAEVLPHGGAVRGEAVAQLVPKFAGQFDTHQQWVNKAQSWLASPDHRRAICVDSLGRRMAVGADMAMARDEGTFPVRFFWECELAPVSPRAADAPSEPSEHRFNSLGISENWSVTVEANGESVLCISDQHVAGIAEPGLDAMVPTIESAALHLLGFIGKSRAADALASQPAASASQESIGDDARFREFLSAWYRGKSGTSRPAKVERDLAALVAYIDSRAPAAAAASAWQPIETAPRTGRTVLLGCLNSMGNWRTMRGQWFTKEKIEQDWEETDGFEAGWYETAEEPDCPNCWPIDPTHWMPLPAAPQSQEKGAES